MVFALFSVAVTVLTHLYVVNVAISSCLPLCQGHVACQNYALTGPLIGDC